MNTRDPARDRLRSLERIRRFRVSDFESGHCLERVMSILLANDNEPPPLIAARPWTYYELSDLRAATKSGYVLDHIAVYLCRTEQEVRDKAAEIGLPLNE
jgi:hypothetical protein